MRITLLGFGAAGVARRAGRPSVLIRSVSQVANEVECIRLEPSFNGIRSHLLHSMEHFVRQSRVRRTRSDLLALPRVPDRTGFPGTASRNWRAKPNSPASRRSAPKPPAGPTAPALDSASRRQPRAHGVV